MLSSATSQEHSARPSVLRACCMSAGTLHASIAAVFGSFLERKETGSLDDLIALRSRLASSADCNISSLAAEARSVYNHIIERKPDLTNTHLRALCLSVISSADQPLRDPDKSAHAKHWARCGLQFVLFSQPDEAERALQASSRLLSETVETESIEVLEVELQIKGCHAHVAWCRCDMRSVLRHVEEAHAMLEQKASAQFLLTSSRLYLSEAVAFRLAARGFETTMLDDAEPSADASGAARVAPDIDRRDLIRLLDLALSLVGSPSVEMEESEITALRDKILRLRAWLCMLCVTHETRAPALAAQLPSSPRSSSLTKYVRCRFATVSGSEDEIEMATHSLNQHSAQSSPEWMLMRCALLFKSNQPAEASAQTVEWIRSGHSLPYVAASDAIEMLCQHQAYQSALTAVNVLSERLAAGFDGPDASSHVATQGTEISQQYSELQEVCALASTRL